MGLAYSTARIDATVEAAMSLTNDSFTKCKQAASGSQVIDVESACGNRDIIISGNKFKINTKYDLRCTQSTHISNDVKQKVEQMMEQLAQSIVKDLGLGATDASTVTDYTTEIATKILDQASLACQTSQAMRQGIYVRDKDGTCPTSPSKIQITYNEFGITEDAIMNCMQDVLNQTRAVQKLKALVSQKALAKVEGIFGPLLFIIAIAALVIFGGSEQMLTSPYFILLILALIAIYGAVAWLVSPKWFPFTSWDKKDDDSNGGKDKNS